MKKFKKPYKEHKTSLEGRHRKKLREMDIEKVLEKEVMEVKKQKGLL